jgi:invasion protein IalB
MFKVRYCAQEGCYAFINLSEPVLKKLRRGNDATIAFKTLKGQNINVKMSLAGFTKALKEIS